MEQLTPGTHVVIRGRDRVQVGFDERRAVLSRTPAHVEALDALGAGPVRLTPTAALTRTLRGQGLVTPAPFPSALARRLASQAPETWQHRLRARQRGGVQVIGSLDVDPQPLLDDCGFGRRPNVALLLGRGGPDPAQAEPLVRRGMPHLALSCTDGAVTLGPFVQPGETACTNCIEMHRATSDPEFPEVARRYREACRADPEPPPDDRVLVTMALAWAVRDLAAWIDGDHPTTWSSTIRLAGSGSPEVSVWMRHPECGCGWTPGLG